MSAVEHGVHRERCAHHGRAADTSVPAGDADDARAGGSGMTSEDLRAVAERIVERMVCEHPEEAAVLAALVLSEILALGLFGGEVAAFAEAVNQKLGEIALARDAPSSWQLVRAEPPRRVSKAESDLQKPPFGAPYGIRTRVSALNRQ
jgi:hypothetical protein